MIKNIIYWGGLYKDFRIFESIDIYTKFFLKPYQLLYKKILDNGYVLRYQVDSRIHSEKPSVIIHSDVPIVELRRFCTLKKLIRSLVEKIQTKNRLYRYSNARKILLLLESPSVYPENYLKENHYYYDYILTQDDYLVDNIKYFKIYQPVYFDNTEYLINFNIKKFCLIINSNKKSNVKGELYSKRLGIVQSFVAYDATLLDVYGEGWEEFPNAKGRVLDKLEVMCRYKFAICYENFSSGSGYITEKIFDCFIAGIIPIYWGAPNIEEHIPKDLFIDRRDYKSNVELINYLRAIRESEYNEIIKKIKCYLISPDFYKWSPDNFANTIFNVINKDTKNDTCPK